MIKKVLIITYYFPPRPGVASLRLKGLAKYLPEFGWEPVILTADLPGVPDQRFKVIETNYPGDTSAIFRKKLGLYPDKRFQEQIRILNKATGGKKFFTDKLPAQSTKEIERRRNLSAITGLTKSANNNGFDGIDFICEINASISFCGAHGCTSTA